jgi:hypothetical protein
MPSANRFVAPNGLMARLRERPLTLAAGALVCGALLGGLMVGKPADSPNNAPVRAAETTGSAQPSGPVAKAEATSPANDSTASVDCEQQTWPYLSHECASRKRRSVRVITTDRLAEPVVSAIEAPPPPSNVSPTAPAPAGNVSPTVPPPAGNASPTASPLAPPPQTAAVEPSASVPPPAAASGTTDGLKEVSTKEVSTKEVSPREVSTKEVSPREVSPKEVSKQPKRKKAKSRERSIDRSIEVDEDSDQVGERDRGGARVVERWTEREYDVPSDDRSGRRRVIVIERGSARAERGTERRERRGREVFFGRQDDDGFPFRF